MKEGTVSYVYLYPWQIVVEAHRRRFPRNKYEPYLLNSALTEESYDPGSLTYKFVRTVTIDPEMPVFIRNMFRLYHFEFRQECTLDLKSMTLTMVGRNITYGGVVHLRERCVYTRHPTHPNWTHFTQTASIELPVIAAVAESHAVQRYSKNSSAGRLVDHYMIEEVLRDKCIYPPHSHIPHEIFPGCDVVALALAEIRFFKQIPGKSGPLPGETTPIMFHPATTTRGVVQAVGIGSPPVSMHGGRASGTTRLLSGGQRESQPDHAEQEQKRKIRESRDNSLSLQQQREQDATPT